MNLSDILLCSGIADLLSFIKYSGNAELQEVIGIGKFRHLGRDEVDVLNVWG